MCVSGPVRSLPSVALPPPRDSCDLLTDRGRRGGVQKAHLSVSLGPEMTPGARLSFCGQWSALRPHLAAASGLEPLSLGTCHFLELCYGWKTEISVDI